MKLVGNLSPASPPPWTTPTITLRVRPEDRPTWIRFQADQDDVEQLRTLANECALPVDVVLALLIEWRLCEDVIAGEADWLARSAARALQEPRLAPTRDLRMWDRQLAGQCATPAGDELPEVSIPQRLMSRTPKVLALAATADGGMLSTAILCERAACRRGMTMETWVLRALLGRRPGRQTPLR